MHRPILARSRVSVLVFAAASGLALSIAATLPSTANAATAPAGAKIKAQPGTAAYTAGRYVVTFADEPAASYDGSVKGFAATKPARGQKLSPKSAAVKAWTNRLASVHDAAINAVGAKKIYSFTVTNNAVTATLTAAQATALAKRSGVVRLEKDKMRKPDTTLSPQFLGLNAPGGVWSQLGGPKKAGAGTVVGIVDSGIWPESAAFKGNTGIPEPATFNGVCQGGEQFPASTCNDKLVGARYYVAGFGAANIADEEFLSPRDGSGHGSHTASTAAGNNGTNVTIDGKAIGTGSGMAPGAKVAAYKVCWEGKEGVAAGCFNSDSVAAINDAVLDGVDVINYSIGGTSESDILDSVEQAFRGASNAGVFVANSAGNSGPGAGTLDHPSPWLTTVAAATFRRAFQVVQLGNGARYVGASTTGPLTTAKKLVTSVSVKLAAATAADAALCVPGTLDPAKAAGKVVQCDRGVVDRIDKGFEVQRAGGLGLVLTNTSPNSLNGDFHPVPAVHIDEVKGAAVKAYITSAGAGATAKIVPLTAAELAAAPKVPEITDFSSRGPSTTTGGDILKPDIAAPGNDVVAAVAPPSNHGRSWDFYSGTSMSSPHIAGIGALIMAKHPDWLPSEVKSAMMTSAGDTVSSATDPFAQGAGFIKPNAAVSPGLVYPTTADEYRQYMIGLGVEFLPPWDTLTPISGPDLNQASIAVGSLVGTQTVTRRVKNVTNKKVIYNSFATVPGFNVSVTPSQLTLNAGQEKTFTVKFTRTTAALNAWAKGRLVWSGGGSPVIKVRSPIALRPVAIQAPEEVHGEASASGSEPYDVTPGFSGTLTSTVSGLVGVTPTADSVVAGPFDVANPTPGPATKKYSVVIPAGTTAARFSLDSVDDADDLDLFVYQGTTLVGVSASGSADEEVTFIGGLPATTLDVYVNGFGTTPAASAAPYLLSNFVVPSASLGNATVTPSPTPVTTGTPVSLSANWTGLDPAKRYFGVISYSGADDVTVFSVG